MKFKVTIKVRSQNVGLLQTIPAIGLPVCSSIRVLVIKTQVAVVCLGTFGKKLNCLLRYRKNNPCNEEFVKFQKKTVNTVETLLPGFDKP
jgi:hypothetical protein